MPVVDILGMLQSGSPVTDVLRTVRQTAELPDEPELWKRCALLRSIDPGSYKAASSDLRVHPFEKFVEDPDWYVVSQSDRSYAISESRRPDAFRAWRNDLEGLAAFANRMKDFYSQRGRILDAFAMKILTPAPDSGTDFETLYLDADATFNVPRCTLLLEILRVRYDLLTPALRELWNKYDAYLRARNLFSDDYHRSALYLDRATLGREFDRFWSNSEQWLLEVFGKGGMGKTMYIRWLISQRCVRMVPERPRIAVARLDFDVIQLNAFTRWPWLALQPIAQQLSPQIENNRLKEFVEQHQAAAAGLRLGQIMNQDITQRLASVGARAPADFQSALGAENALIIFDTCEEPLLHRRHAFRKFLEMLFQIRSKGLREGLRPSSGLRVLLSGRYRASDKGRLPEVGKLFAGHLKSIEVKAFSDEEAREYLRTKRSVTEKRIVNAIVKKSKGNPFGLSLFADLWHSPKGLTVEDVEKAPTNEFVYLLDRVVLRIPQAAVRWLLRYSVIPRELTFDFVKHVLAPYLPQGVVSDAGQDRANEFDDALLRYRDRKPWPRARIGQLRKVWADLARYASDPSWITVDEKADTVRLQPEVVEPMRALLRTQTKLFDRLQRASEKYWRTLAGNKRENWGQYTAEAVFHLFQRLGQDGAAKWSQILRSPFARNPAVRKQLANVLLSASFLDETGRPRPFRNRLMVDAVTLARAHFEVGYAALIERLRLGRLNPEAALPTSELDDRWNDLRAVSPSVRAAAVRHSSLRLLQFGVHVFSGKPLSLSRIRAARAWRLPPAQRLTARVLAFSASYDRVLRGLPASDIEYDDAIKLSKKLRSKEFTPSWIQYRRGMSFFRRGELSSAARDLESSFDEMLNTNHADLQGVFWRLIAVLRLRGEFNRRSKIISKLQKSISGNSQAPRELHFQLYHANALMALDFGDPLAARHLLETASSFTGSYDTDPASHELAGIIDGELMEMATADDHFEIAIKEYPTSGWGRRFAEIRRAAARAAIGDMRGARIRIRSAHSWQQRLELAAVFTKDQFRKLSFTELLDSRSGPIEMRLQVAAKALAYRRLPQLKKFFNEFRKLDSEETKYHVLIPFGEARALSPEWPRSMKMAASALPPPPSTSNPGFAVQAIALANAHRFFGNFSTALDILSRIPEQEPFLERKILQTRAGAAPKKPFEVQPYLDRFCRHFADFPLLTCAAQTEAAEWLIQWRQFSEAKQVLAAAEVDLQRSRAEATEWNARWDQAVARVAKSERDLSTADMHIRRAHESSLIRGDVVGQRTTAAAMRRVEKDEPSAVAPKLIRDPDTWTFRSETSTEFSMSFQLPKRGGGRFIFKRPDWLSHGLETGFSFVDIQNGTAELGTLIDPFLKHLTPAGGRLRISPDTLSAVPWEFLAPSQPDLFYRSRVQDAGITQTVRWMQFVLSMLGFKIPNTGSASDPEFREALQQFYLPGEMTPHKGLMHALRRKVPQTNLLHLIEPTSDWQFNHKRGYALESTDIEYIYKLSGLSVSRGHIPLPPLNPVHIVAGLQLDTDGKVQLELDPRSVPFETRDSKCDARGLLRLLSGAPRAIGVILIDTPMPPDPGEANRQALLRNLFCAQLFESGFCRGVLGIGLFHYGQAANIFQQMTDSLTSGSSLTELHRLLMSNSSAAVVPPALWADDPDLPVM